jgi:hypothetical protein
MLGSICEPRADVLMAFPTVGETSSRNGELLRYPKVAKSQIHKATKREKRQCTSDPGSQGAASRSTTA